MLLSRLGRLCVVLPLVRWFSAAIGPWRSRQGYEESVSVANSAYRKCALFVRLLAPDQEALLHVAARAVDSWDFAAHGA